MARNKHPEVTINRILDVSTALFLEKGYDNTTIQDIINALGNLSKGAIYHHFKSKEEIIDAVTERMYGSANEFFEKLKASKNLNGLEKIKQLLYMALENPVQETIARVLPNLLENPKLLAKQIDSAINKLAHEIIQDLIIEGIEDGSIETDYPKELAEVFALLMNVWINPLVLKCTRKELYNKCMFFKQITKAINFDIFDDEMVRMVERLVIE